MYSSLKKIDDKDNITYTRKGFTGSVNVVLPEYFQDTRKFMNGDILNIIDADTGKIISKFKYDIKFGWIDFILIKMYL